MGITVSALTVLFEEPFWIALYERESDGIYEVCKIIFGTEPKDYEVYDFILRNWGRLEFSPGIESGTAAQRRVNPKRLQRIIAAQTEPAGIGTKAQQALKLQQEQGRLERRTRSREMREKEKQRRFELRQGKRREKHKGH